MRSKPIIEVNSEIINPTIAICCSGPRPIYFIGNDRAYIYGLQDNMHAAKSPATERRHSTLPHNQPIAGPPFPVPGSISSRTSS